MPLIIEDRFRAKVPCTPECNLRWRERADGTVEFRHGKRSKRVSTTELRSELDIGWLTEAMEWVASLHDEGDW